MKFKLAEITPDFIKKSIFAKEVESSTVTGYTELVSKPQIETGDYYENLAYVGKKIDGTPIIVILIRHYAHQVFLLKVKIKRW